jgi:hypothetical protein
MTIDPVAHAYATIGLRPGASARELKQQYKRLVKTWHPDRWASDPVSQAEAAQKMRAINAAYATLHRLQTAAQGPPASPPASSHANPADHWSASHRSMTREELDAIVDAIGNDSYVSGVLRALAWVLPFAGAIAATRPRRDLDGFAIPLTTREVTMAGLLFSTGIAVLAWQKWIERTRRNALRRTDDFD